jgi:hypothetical protein
MREMALLATSNGDSDPRLYGSDPNNGNTWDADRIYGCICDEGWTGYDCSERECTYGDDPNTYGQVNEVQLFECAGTAGTLTLSFRQKTTLPIAYNATRQELEEALEWLTNECNKHGRCATMREMALLATSNGDSDPRLYGSDPNNGNTWDADRIYGCICDEGWTGYDCSERECTYGDDPNTYGQVNEVQLFECAGTAGTLTLSFRQKTTLPIAYNASRQELEEALEWLTNIGDVIVLFSSGSVQRREFKLGQPCALSSAYNRS